MTQAQAARHGARIPLLSVALLSVSVLAYEILLMRLFSIIQWHHFAYMVISLALLGYGVSGTLVTLLRARLLAHFAAVYTGCIGAFALSAVYGFLLAQQVPFNAELVLWDARQSLWLLLLLYLLLATPFLFAATAIALALMRHSDEIGRLYAFDLAGAGLGGLVVIGLLFLFPPLQALAAIGLLGLLAAAIAVRETGLADGRRLRALLGAGAVVLLGAGLNSELHLSPYKGLSQTLLIPGTRLTEQYSSPLGLLSVVESAQVPLRHAPGLSLLATQEPPPQLGVFTDGDAMTAITRDSGDRSALTWLDQTTSALPYHLHDIGTALILGAGTGADVLQADSLGVTRISAVELNPQVVALVRDRHAAYAGHLYQRVAVHVAEARGFVAGSSARYDLINIALLDAFGAAAAGLYALNESYLYTVEALEDYLGHLNPGGYLSITRWVTLPPRDTLKLFVTALAALEHRGVKQAGRHLVLIRSWQTATLVIKNEPFTAAELARLRDFVRQRGFDTAWYDGMPAAEANRVNRLREPYFYDAARQLTGADRARYLDDYKYALTPATDNRPYFFHFFKWHVLPELLALRGQGGMPLLEWGYLVLVATLLQALLASVVLILVPLLALRRHATAADVRTRAGRGRVVVYFTAIGLAFLFVEMAFIQRFTLLLHHPLYAVATTLTGFLVFAGLGSRWSQRWTRQGRQARGTACAVAGIAGISLAYLGLLQVWPAAATGWPLPAKVMLVLVMIAPLAFCMGMPFPLGLSRLAATAPGYLPWAWGVNGCASVISAVLATLLAIHCGFTTVILLAVTLYGIAALSVPGGGAVAR
ncbi:MAG: SAM-dependent methyltransferase [Pseudomonadota bacterium]